MRLLRRQSNDEVTLTENFINSIPPYAILSHTWGVDHDEVSFNDLNIGYDGTKEGYYKLQFCGKQAELDGIQYFWVDTCCIDKANHTELSEAIASMFRWYQNARKCYVYMADVPTRDELDQDTRLLWESKFRNSRWFTRGWTLQELLAPRIVEFYSSDGKYLGNKISLERLINEATGIPTRALRGAALTSFGIEERRLWASQRQTTREEDAAYCLQGLFGVYIPLIYGEGTNAFRRLEKAIAELPNEDEDANNSERPRKRMKVDDRTQLLEELENKMHNRRLNVERRHRHTCEWILNVTEYNKWTSEPFGLLWIKGKPGAGKSTVMAFLHDEVNGNADSVLQTVSCIRLNFFFSARGTELQRNIRGMLRSLLHQLLLQDDFAWKGIRTIFNDKLRSFGGSRASWEWQVSELELLFAETVVGTGQSQPVILFVDALDEAGEQSARHIAEYFHRLNEQAASVQASIRICISCRHYPIVTSKRSCSEVTVEDHNNDDIATFIHDKLCLDQEVDRDPSEQEDWRNLESELITRAQGLFQWARLVVPLVQRRIAKGESPAWARQKLRDVPLELRDVYVYILYNIIDEEDRPLSFLLFQWVCLAARPLTITEMRYALDTTDMHPSIKQWFSAQPNDVITTDSRMKLRIAPLSGGLMEVVSPGESLEYVQVTHQSVNDFMLTEGLSVSACLSNNITLEPPALSSASCIGNIIVQCHARLYWTCLQYMARDEIRSEWHPAYETQDICRRWPFVNYATLFMCLHAEGAASHRTNNLLEEIAILERIIPLWTRLCRIMHRNEPVYLGPQSKLLHVASQANMRDVIEHCISISDKIDVQNSRGQTALHIAARCNHQELADILVKSGANVNIQDRYGRTAIHCAVGQGHISMVRWLLGHGASITSKTAEDPSVLHAAASEGHVEIVKFLIDMGLEVNTVCDEFGSVLQAASKGGHERVVQVLLDAGANVNAQGGDDNTALQAAAASNRKNIVQILLNAGADVNLQGGRYGNALQMASSDGHKDIVAMLLDAGAKINMLGGYYQTALQAASANSKYGTVRMLLDRGADPDLRGGFYYTAIQAALMHHGKNTVEMLLAAGANVNIEGGYYGNPLQIAAAHSSDEVVRMLLNKGANTNLFGGHYGTALQAASARYYSAGVRILLDAGADVNAVGGYYGTALQAAAANNRERAVRMLLNAGADVDLEGGHHGSALQAARDNRHDSIIEILLKAKPSKKEC